MSARRKGKPQQRKKIEAHMTIHFTHENGGRLIEKVKVEPEQDYLTCGDCQRDFLLSDILKFIQHKINRCNKENVDPFEENDYENEDGHQEPISSVITSISAPIAQRKGTPELRPDKSPRPSLSLFSVTAPADADSTLDGTDDVKPDLDKLKPSSPSRNTRDVKCRDTASNTTLSEPTNVICGTCKLPFGSSWDLLQHAQRHHGMKIYLDDSEPPKPKKKPVPPLTPSDNSSDRGESKENNGKIKAPSVEHLSIDERDRSHTPMSSISPASSHPKTPTSQHPVIHSTPRTPPAMGLDMLTQSPRPPFMFPMPGLPDRPPISPAAMNHGPFNRPPLGEFHFDFISDSIQRMQAMGLPQPPGFEHPPGLLGFPPNPFERHIRPPQPPPPPPQPSTQTGDGPDFYSQRLRRLAGTTSPSAEPESPIRKQATPPFPGQQTSPYPTSPTTPSTPGTETPNRQAMSPGKLKACEFCGKCFRFQSNLIVHRRSHTGEKPFKCPMCPHACTQASKLKRHMRTHGHKAGVSSSASQASSMSTGSENSIRSTCSTPDSKMSKMGDGEDSELDEEDDDEDEEAAMEEARKMGAFTDEPTDLEREKFYADDTSEEPTDLTVPNLPGGRDAVPSSSLLREVMENSGLKDIREYSEAFKAALAENSNKKDTNSNPEEKPRRESVTPTKAESITSSEAITENGHSEPESADRDSISKMSNASQEENRNGESYGKRIKLEPQERERERDRDRDRDREREKERDRDEAHERDRRGFPPGMDRFYSQIWFPPPSSPREFFMGHMFQNDHFHVPPGGHENGLSSSENMFGKLDCNRKLSPGQNPLAPVSRGALPTTPDHIRKERGRNDTCEFCGKIFKNCSNLTVHRRSHTGEKPYKCRMCNYACAQSSKLTRHMRTHGRMGKDVYNCKFCNMPFSVPSTLEKHMRKCVETQPSAARQALAAATIAATASPLVGLPPMSSSGLSLSPNNSLSSLHAKMSSSPSSLTGSFFGSSHPTNLSPSPSSI